MDQLSAGELLELILLGESSIDVQFQLWLTITFATIIAGFAARRLLTRQLRWAVTVLYLLATVVVASRWYYDAQDIFLYRQWLTQTGFETPRPIVTMATRVLLMIVGTLAAIYFLHTNSAREES